MRQMRVASNVPPQRPTVFVVVRNRSIRFVPQGSNAVGISKDQGVPHCTTLLLGQLTSGGVVSTTDTVWLQSAKLPHASVMRHLRVAVNVSPHAALVVSGWRTSIRLVPQASVAVGGSNVHVFVHSTDLLVGQLILGGVVSTTFTV